MRIVFALVFAAACGKSAPGSDQPPRADAGVRKPDPKLAEVRDSRALDCLLAAGTDDVLDDAPPLVARLVGLARIERARKAGAVGPALVAALHAFADTNDLEGMRQTIEMLDAAKLALTPADAVYRERLHQPLPDAERTQRPLQIVRELALGGDAATAGGYYDKAVKPEHQRDDRANVEALASIGGRDKLVRAVILKSPPEARLDLAVTWALTAIAARRALDVPLAVVIESVKLTPARSASALAVLRSARRASRASDVTALRRALVATVDAKSPIVTALYEDAVATGDRKSQDDLAKLVPDADRLAKLQQAPIPDALAAAKDKHDVARVWIRWVSAGADAATGKTIETAACR